MTGARLFVARAGGGRRQPLRRRAAQAVRRSLAGRPVLARTLDRLARRCTAATTVVVLAPGDAHYARLVGARHGVERRRGGGATRAATVAQRAGARSASRCARRRLDRRPRRGAALRAARTRCGGWSASSRDDPVGGLLAVPVADTLKRARAAIPAPRAGAAHRGPRRPVAGADAADVPLRPAARGARATGSARRDRRGAARSRRWRRRAPARCRGWSGQCAQRQGHLSARTSRWPRRSSRRRSRRLSMSCASATASTSTRWSPGRKLVLGGVDDSLRARPRRPLRRRRAAARDRRRDPGRAGAGRHRPPLSRQRPALEGRRQPRAAAPRRRPRDRRRLPDRQRRRRRSIAQAPKLAPHVAADARAHRRGPRLRRRAASASRRRRPSASASPGAARASRRLPACCSCATSESRPPPPRMGLRQRCRSRRRPGRVPRR